MLRLRRTLLPWLALWLTPLAPAFSQEIFQSIKTEDILARAEKLYHACQTYQDRGAVRILRVPNNYLSADTEKNPTTGSTSVIKLFTTAFEAPRTIRYEVQEYQNEEAIHSTVFWSDGFTQKIQSNFERETPTLRKEHRNAWESNQSAYGRILNPVFEYFDTRETLFDHPISGSIEPIYEGEEMIATTSAYKISFPDYRDDPVLYTYWFRKKDFALVKIMREIESPEAYTQIVALFMPSVNQRILPYTLDFNAPKNVFFQVATTYLNFGTEKRSSQFVSMRDLLKTPEREKAQANAEASSDAETPLTPSSLLSPEQEAALVILKGNRSNAVGFHTTIRGKSFIVSCQNIFLDNDTLSPELPGDSKENITVLQMYGASSHDVSLFEVFENRGRFDLTEDIAQAEPGDSVLIPSVEEEGNLRITLGKIDSIENTKINLKGKLGKRHNGSPIILRKNQTVIGVVTFTQTEKTVRTSRNPSEPIGKQRFKTETVTQTEWFGHRLDNISNWQKIEWNSWNEQKDKVKAFTQVTEDLKKVLSKKDFKNIKDSDVLRIIADYQALIRESNRGNDYYARNTRLFAQELINLVKFENERARQIPISNYFSSTPHPDYNLEKSIQERTNLIDKFEYMGNEGWYATYRKFKLK